MGLKMISSAPLRFRVQHCVFAKHCRRTQLHTHTLKQAKSMQQLFKCPLAVFNSTVGHAPFYLFFWKAKNAGVCVCLCVCNVMTVSIALPSPLSVHTWQCIAVGYINAQMSLLLYNLPTHVQLELILDFWVKLSLS